MDNLVINCEEMVCLPSGLRMYQNVVFRPTPETVTAINAAQDKGGWHTVEVNDGGGCHTSTNTQRVLSVRYQRNTIVFISQEP